MKKLLLILTVCTALTGCSYTEADMDVAKEKRALKREAQRQVFGCDFLDDHSEYRDCLLKTYQANTPKTYTTTTNKDGKAVAIIKDTTTKSYDKEANIYKTERVIVIETEERLVPVPMATPAEEIKTETVNEEVVSTTPDNTTETALVEAVPTTPEIAPEEPKPEPTWWKTYQEEKEVTKPTEPVCPCPDPNTPCPQCVDK